MTYLEYDFPTKTFSEVWDQHWQTNGRRYFLGFVLLAEVLLGFLVARVAGG